MRLPWRREARQINSRPVSNKALELETAKEILSRGLPCSSSGCGRDDPEKAGGKGLA